MKVAELTRDELKELKCRYALEKYGIFCFEDGADEQVSDKDVFKEYDGVEFVKDDFFCNKGV